MKKFMNYVELLLRIIIGLSIISFIQIITFVSLYLCFTLPVLIPFTEDISYRITMFLAAGGSAFLQLYVAMKLAGVFE